MSETEKDRVRVIHVLDVLLADNAMWHPKAKMGLAIGATGRMAEALEPLFAEVRAKQREADAAIAVSMIDNEPDGYYGQACSEVAAAFRGASDD